jgi:dihydrofolate reductase
MTLHAIVAMSQNRVIGQNNCLPWHLPADLRHFKAITLGKPILMGRKTFASIGRPLPQRTNIILTHDSHFTAPGCLISHSLDEAIATAASLHETVMIIGGAKLYEQALPRAQRLYLTLVHHDFVGDAFFPPLAPTEWQETECTFHPADAENPYAYSFIIFERVGVD